MISSKLTHLRTGRRGFAPRQGLLAALILLSAAGCSTVYYSAWEKLGYEKRDLLRSNVEDVREDQEAVSEQFVNTLERIRQLYGLEASELEAAYDRFKAAYEKSENKAAALRERIDKVEEVAGDLFAEWERELGEISDASLRAKSRLQLDETRQRYARLAAALARSEAGLDPVLQSFKDQVLFLKHSLNAQALGSLEAEMGAIERDVERLIEDLEVSIRQADTFIRELPQ
ncbi:MAG: DUF2959 domain-containing protein [Acidobacteriota bacterium]|nr:DUF2959 domain-containing protein [Acidobacteriota bacterium]